MNWKKLFAPNGKVVRPGKEEFMKSKQKNRNIPPGDVCCGAYRKGVK